MACALCQTRRERRPCPGVNASICTLCCGTQREETIDCPIDCEFLEIAHRHEDLQKDPSQVPNANFPIPENFLEKNVDTIMSVQHAILTAALEKNAIDFDVKEALDGLVRTYQTLESGLVFESRPANPIAAALFDAIQARLEEANQFLAERSRAQLTGHQALTLLVFLQHLEFALNNGRRRGRGFLESTFNTVSDVAEQMEPEPPSLLIS